MKGVIDKLFKATSTEMIMHSYYTSGLNFVTDVRRMLTHCTEKRSMTISDELYKNTLENGVKRRMPITWGTFNCIEPIDAETVAAVIAASAEGNYFYTTRMPTSDSDEDGSAIDSDGEEEHCIFGKMKNDENVYIYPLRVERADRKRTIYTQANFKDMSTQTWADLGSVETEYHHHYETRRC